MTSALSGARRHCEALVRAQDPDRYFATLLAPAPSRDALFALYAFSSEIAGVRDGITHPLPGEIRLQWWRDALTGAARGDVEANPVAAALDEAIRRFALPRQALLNLIDAREFDLYDDPMPAAADLEGYLGETASVLIQLAALVTNGPEAPRLAEAAGHAGLAQGITGLMRALPWHAGRGQLYLPGDILSRHGVTRDDIIRGRGGPGVTAALADLRNLARHHLERARAHLPALGSEPAFLPVALVPGYLADMEKPGYDPFRSRIERPAWRVIATLWWARRAGGSRPARVEEARRLG